MNPKALIHRWVPVLRGWALGAYRGRSPRFAANPWVIGVAGAVLLALSIIAARELRAAVASLLATTPGTYTWTVPAGVTQFTVELWGAGGAGGAGRSSAGSAGGGSGGYARAQVNTTPGSQFRYLVGQGGNGSGAVSALYSCTGGNCTALVASAGGGGAGNGATQGSAGTGSVASGYSGTTSPGAAGAAPSGNRGGNGGTAPNGLNGVLGGAGGLGGGSNKAGAAGAAPGGGGGGGGKGATAGAGGNGQVLITYDVSQVTAPSGFAYPPSNALYNTSAGSASPSIDTGGGIVTYSGTPPASSVVSGVNQISLNTTTGVVSWTSLVPIGTHTFQVTASNGTSPNATATFTLVVGAFQLSLSTIGTQTVGTPFSVTATLVDPSGTDPNPRATGANGTVTLSVYSGTGTLSGTPSCTIPVGSSQCTINNVSYSVGESSVILAATGTGAGSNVNGASGLSNAFNVTALYSISGTVFEDVNYGGGLGRARASATGFLTPPTATPATVELYNSSGAFVSSATTGANGTYTFSSLVAGTYYVRVPSATVRSARTGATASLVGVLTYRTDAATGSAVAVTDHVGGTNPALVDPGTASAGATFNTSTFVYTAGLTGTAQAVSNVTLTSASVSGVDFGFNFNTVVNANNSGQGSLRQAITNANTLTDETTLPLTQVGRTANVENLVFMIPNGTTGSGGSLNLAAGGLRSSINLLTGGVATIPLASALPAISTTMVVDARTQPGWVSTPLVELNGASAGNTPGLSVTASNSTVAGFVINRFAGAGIAVASGGNTTTIQANWIGLNAAGTAVMANGLDGINVTAATGAVIGGTTAGMGNAIGGASGSYYAINLQSSSGHAVLGNTIGVQGDGATALASPGNGVLLNAVTGSSIGGVAQNAGNTIRLSSAKGIVVTGASSGNPIRGNAIHGSTGLGIDLANDGISANDGAKTAGQPNLLMDSPVFTTASMSGTTLTVAGYVGTAAGQATFASATVDVYLSDASSAHGSGQRYLGTLTADLSGNFSGTISGISGVSNGSSRITAVATDAAGHSSEFGTNYVLGLTIAGTVFEDVNYTGGPGRALASATGALRPPAATPATVELYNSSGVFVSSTTTGASGGYVFGGLSPSVTYHVRVVSGSVRSGRTGATSSLLGVLTYRTSTTAGTVSGVADTVGGINPAIADVGNASSGATFSTSSYVFSAGLSGTAHAVAQVGLGTADVSGVDFGFNFNTVVNVNDSGQGSLRQAITNANTLTDEATLPLAQTGRTASTDNIVFMIPNGTTGSGGSLNLAAGGLRSTLNYRTTNANSVATITLSSSSNAVTVSSPMIIDAQTQPGWSADPVIELNGANIAGPVNGLSLTSAGITVRGLIINRFSGAAISVSGAGASAGTGVTLQGNWVGVDATGLVASPNAGNGIDVTGAHATLGGATAAQRNVVAGNAGMGVSLAATAGGTVVTGNWIGLGKDGSTAVPNGSHSVSMACSTACTLGGTTAALRNVISGGTAGHGVFLAGTGNVLYGNYVGLDAGGTLARGTASSSTDGIYVDAAARSPLIGGSTPGQGNVVSAHARYGINVVSGATGVQVLGNYVGTNAAGTAALANAQGGVQSTAVGVTIGGTAAGAGNLISGNTTFGVSITGGSATVQGNWVGVNAAGTAALANTQDGVVAGVAGLAIGSANVIAGNGRYGINITAASVSVQGSYVGTDKNGTAAVPNAQGGVLVAAPGAGIGAASAGNVISGNAGFGISITASTVALPVRVQGNYIGTNPTGTAALANTGVGVQVSGTSSVAAVTVGGTSSTLRNLISGNGSHGVLITGGATGNTVAGNYVGLDVTGTSALANGDVGVYVSGGSASNTIGGTTASARNHIAGNASAGVALGGANTSGNLVQGNWIGLNVSGMVVSNRDAGVRIEAGATGNTIGGLIEDVPNAGNVIQGTLTSGVRLGAGVSVAAGASGNRIAGNAISGNAGAGIDLGDDGRTANDGGKSAALANEGMDTPVITGATARGGTLTVSGYVGSAAGQSAFAGARVEFFLTDADASGFGEGATYLGRLTADGAGNFSGSFAMVPGPLTPGAKITATATDSTGNTSEFGANFSGLIVDLLVNDAGDADDANPGDGLCQTATAGQCTLRAALSEVNALSGARTIAFALPACPGSGCSIAPASALPTVTRASVTIDGQTQTGWTSAPLVEIVGTSAPAGTSGLTLGASGITVRGLLINGFGGAGLAVSGAAGSAVIEGNWIGLQASGTGARANAGNGIDVAGANATLGGTSSAQRNLVAGNTGIGIALSATAGGAVVTGNWVGLGSDGSTAVRNGSHGVSMACSTTCTLGGQTAAQRNTITGGTAGHGVFVAGSGNRLYGNYVGTDAGGTLARGTPSASHDGIHVDAAAVNPVIGGSTTGQGNVVSGHARYGINVAAGASGVQILGNYVGTHASGGGALPNGLGGILVSANGTTVGSTTPASGNLVSGNTGFGIGISAANVTVQGNYVGTTQAGSVALPNGAAGIQISGAASVTGVTVGGTTGSARNVVSGNVGPGILITGGASGNTVSGNYVGLDVSGVLALPNGAEGIYLKGGSANNVIGGTTANARNHIAGNLSAGVAIGESGTGGNRVQGNWIGQNVNGAAVGNRDSGVRIEAGATGNIIGGLIESLPEAGNVIRATTAATGARTGYGAGVSVAAGASGNRIAGNSITGNAGLGIDLDDNAAVNANDGTTASGSANLGMDFPVISGARVRGSVLTVSGVVGTAAGQSAFSGARIEFFVSDGDASGHGEGVTYLGTLTADGSGNFSGTVALSSGALRAGTLLTATATQADGHTSEFGPTFSNMIVDLLVNHAGDAPDATPGDGLCETATTGQCTLRAALQEANALGASRATPPACTAGAVAGSGCVTIAFALPSCPGAGCTIAPAGVLPTVSVAVIIDGQTQSGWTANPVVEIDGSGAGAGVTGLTLAAPGVRVRGLILNGFGGSGLSLTSAAGSTVIEGNWIGLQSSGMAPRPNGGNGIDVAAANTTIGGAASVQRNLISGNTGIGLSLASTASGSLVTGNWIGLGLDGSTALRNGSHSVSVACGGACTIGGNSAALRNVIAGGNTGHGVLVAGNGNGLYGNFIGTDSGGTAARGTVSASYDGVWVDATAVNAVIGGAGSGLGNVVSGHARNGISVAAGASGTTLTGNFVGTTASGTSALANAQDGISVGAASTVVGGTGGAGNLASGNGRYGIAVSGASVTVHGNYVGTNAAGTGAVPNAQGGIVASGANGAIGGTATGSGNLVSGNTGFGIGVTAGGVTVQGNYVGTVLGGSAALANGGVGVVVSGGASGVVIGGPASGARNLISGNGSSGIQINGAASGNTVSGNYIGLDATGSTALSNAGEGVYLLQGAANNTVGGVTAADRNVIAGNVSAGVAIGGAGTAATGNRIAGNWIGINASGNTVANRDSGVRIETGASANTIGGTESGAGNTIQGTGTAPGRRGAGVAVAAGATGNRILANSITGNAGLGIDLGDDGLSVNDGAKSGSAANQGMDYPVIGAARARGSALTVSGHVGSAAGQGVFGNARVEFFVSDGDASGYGEGATYLGTLTTDASGNFSGTLTMPVSALRVGAVLTATATGDLTGTSGNTSEFGPHFAGLIVDLLVNEAGDADDATPGDGLCQTGTAGQCTLRAAITEANASPGTQTIAFALPSCPGSGCTLAPASALPTITAAAVIDGQTQTGWSSTPIVELRGTGAGAAAGLTLGASGVTVRGLVINGFGGAGIVVASGGASAAIEGNWIGLQTDGSTARGNGGSGIDVSAANVTIGGTGSTTQRNVISGNLGAAGIALKSGATGAQIAGNYIGTDASGLLARGNSGSGIQLGPVSGVQIGSVLSAARNLISGNGADGIGSDAGGASGGSGGEIKGNWIGLGADGATLLGNARHGVAAMGAFSNLTVGGTEDAAGNTIAGNGQSGVFVAAGSSRVNVQRNAITGNGGLGIDLTQTSGATSGDGVTANDGAVAGSQANIGMDRPVLGTVGTDGTTLTVDGYVGSATGQAAFGGVRVDFYRADSDGSGAGEGSVWLGYLTTGADGRFSGSITLANGAFAQGQWLTATATDANGNTSEFADNRAAGALAAQVPSSLNAFDASTPAGAVTGTLGTKVAGIAFNAAVVAIDRTGSALNTSWTGSVQIEWMDASDNSGADAGNGCRSSWVARGTAGTATFASGSQGRASVSITPPDAGRSWRLRLTATNGNATAQNCSTDAFAVMPASLTITQVGDGDAGTAGTARMLNNTSPSGGVVHKAGQPFSLRAAARDAAGATTSGYNGTPRVAIAACTLPTTGCVTGTLTTGTLTASGGIVASDVLTYSEVGAIRILMIDDTFTAVDSGDTPLAARTLTSAQVDVGRFVPNHYRLSLAQAGRLAVAQNSCAASGRGFTFVGQPFRWATVPQVTVTAEDAANNVTRNWSGSLQRLAPATGVTRANALTGTLPALSTNWAAMTLTDAGNGSATLAFAAGDSFVFDRDPARPMASFQAGIDFSVAVSDGVEAGGASGNPTISSLAAVRASGATQLPFDNGGWFHYGRLRLQNAFGDARRGIRALLELQTYDGSNWLRLDDDRGCLSFAPSSLGFTAGTGFLSGNACLAPVTASVTTARGRADVVLPKSPGNLTGATAIVLNILGSVEGSSCAGSPAVAGTPLSAGLPWLATTRSSSSFDSNPMSRITWGSIGREWIGQRELY